MALDQRRVALAVLLEVVGLHPTHLTLDELVGRLSGKQDEGTELRDAIRGLEQSGLLRSDGDALAPTDGALHATEIFTL